MPAVIPALLYQLRHQAGPAGLVAGTDPRAVIAMEIFIEKRVVFPVGIGLEFFGAAVKRPAAGIWRERKIPDQSSL